MVTLKDVKVMRSCKCCKYRGRRRKNGCTREILIYTTGETLLPSHTTTIGKAVLDLTIQTYLLLLEAFINIQLDYDELLVTDLVGIFGLTAHLS